MTKQAKYHLELSLANQHYFTLRAPNGKIIACSEMYESKQAALKGIRSVRKNAGTDVIVGDV